MSGPTEVKTLLEIINSAALDALAEYDNRGERLPGINEIMLAGTSPHEADLSIKLKKMLRTLEGACGQLCATLAPPLHTIVNHAQNYYWSCLRVAARKQIARILQDTPEGMHISDIAAKVDIQTTKLLIIMRTLAARHCFQELSQDIYTNTRISLVLLSHNNASFIDLLTQEGQKTAGNLEEYLSNPVYGPSSGPEKSLFMYGLKESGFQGNLYDWMTINPKRREIMGESMTSMNKVMGTLSILDAYPWLTTTSICDVGCGQGGFSWELLRKFDKVHVTLFDLPEVLDKTRSIATTKFENELSRTHFCAGDFFKDSPPRELDIYYLRNIVHNWPDKEAISILRTIKTCLKPESRILIHDYVIPSIMDVGSKEPIDQAPTPMLPDFGCGSMRVHNQDLTMLFMYNSRERTVDEVKLLGQNAGLNLIHLWDLGETTVLEFGCF